MLLRSLEFALITFVLTMVIAMVVAAIMKLTVLTLKKASDSAATGTAAKEKESKAGS